jgi:hypothetical protein
MFHWSLSDVVDRLRKCTVLFVGLSMSDPSLRRLLDASRNSDIPPHGQIQKRHEIRDHEVQQVMTEVERRARDYAMLLQSGFDEQKKPFALEESIHAALRQAAPPVAAQSVTATRPTPSLQERLDRLAAEIDRNRVDLHVPGAALAIVRGDEVIFARGFGFADVERKTAMTPSTPLFIGSATKTFTATLVGMLVDEGRMRWDDPVETYLPEFKLAVQARAPMTAQPCATSSVTGPASFEWAPSGQTARCRRTRACGGHPPSRPSRRSVKVPLQQRALPRGGTSGGDGGRHLVGRARHRARSRSAGDGRHTGVDAGGMDGFAHGSRLSMG